MGDMPPRLVLIENDDKGGVRSHPGTVDAIEAVVRAYRELPPASPEVRQRYRTRLGTALDLLAEQWPA